MDGGTIDAGVTDADVARVRRAHGLEGRYVLSVGTLEPRKNLPRLLDAFARLTADGDGRHTDVTLAVVGPGGLGRVAGRALARLGDRVRLVGFVPRDDLAPLYRGRSRRVLPEPLGGVRAPGRRGPGRRGTGGDLGRRRHRGVGGRGRRAWWSTPGTRTAIAGALASVLDDDDLANRLRRAAWKRAAETTWATTAALTIAAYEEAAGK